MRTVLGCHLPTCRLRHFRSVDFTRFSKDGFSQWIDSQLETTPFVDRIIHALSPTFTRYAKPEAVSWKFATEKIKNFDNIHKNFKKKLNFERLHDYD